MPRLKKIVCFGGGNALPQVVLSGLKKYPLIINSITSMMQSGGSTGQLRKDLNVLPPGDISRHLIALSEAPQWKKGLFYYRFGEKKFPGGHVGHRFGTVFIACLEYLFKDFEKASLFAHEFLEVKKNRALPATIKKTSLWAELENGQIIQGEDEIDVPKKHDSKLRIKRIFLKPEAKAYPPTLAAIQEADFIILGPGDLYSSLIPCLLPGGIKMAIQKSRAVKIYVCNIMNKLGETNGFSVLDFAGEVEKYLGCSLDLVLYNTEIPDKNRIKEYRKKEPSILGIVKFDKELDKDKFIGKNLLKKKGSLEHNSNKVVKNILKLCRQ